MSAPRRPWPPVLYHSVSCACQKCLAYDICIAYAELAEYIAFDKPEPERERAHP